MSKIVNLRCGVDNCGNLILYRINLVQINLTVIKKFKIRNYKMVEVLIPGHRYKLDLFEDKSQSTEIQFIQKECINLETGELKTINDGITNEQLIEVLVDRMKSMQAKFPCRENEIATTHLETALLWLEKRTADRKKRNVEGKHLK